MIVSQVARTEMRISLNKSLDVVHRLVREASRPYPVSVVTIVRDGNRGEWELEVSLRPADLPRPTLLLEAS